MTSYPAAAMERLPELTPENVRLVLVGLFALAAAPKALGAVNKSFAQEMGARAPNGWNAVGALS
jgi:hypothetical protein